MLVMEASKFTDSIREELQLGQSMDGRVPAVPDRAERFLKLLFLLFQYIYPVAIESGRTITKWVLQLTQGSTCEWLS